MRIVYFKVNKNTICTIDNILSEMKLNEQMYRNNCIFIEIKINKNYLKFLPNSDKNRQQINTNLRS